MDKCERTIMTCVPNVQFGSLQKSQVGTIWSNDKWINNITY